MVRKPPSRPGLQGILVLDKPQGITSHDVVRRVRKLMGTRQVGHTGTLDPLATGVLVVLVGGATRAARYLQEDDKEYRLTLLLGRETDTQDVTGRTLGEADPSGVTREALLLAASRYLGSFEQVPPAYSAVKVEGRPLHKLARRGVTVRVPARTVTIRELELLSWENPRAVFRVGCSKGTYMRTLCHDLGRDLGTGACLEALVRTRSGSFTLEEARTLAALEEIPPPELSGLMRNLAEALPFPSVEVDAPQEAMLGGGKALLWEDVAPPGKASEWPAGPVAAVREGRTVALAEVQATPRGPALVPRRVLCPSEHDNLKELFKVEEK